MSHGQKLACRGVFATLNLALVWVVSCPRSAEVWLVPILACTRGIQQNLVECLTWYDAGNLLLLNPAHVFSLLSAHAMQLWHFSVLNMMATHCRSPLYTDCGKCRGQHTCHMHGPDNSIRDKYDPTTNAQIAGSRIPS